MKKKIVITGEQVHNVGYRLFLFEKAQELCIPNFFAKNVKENGKEKVIVLVDGEEGQIKDFLNFVKVNYPSTAKVGSINEDTSSSLPDKVMSIEAYAHLLQAGQLNKGVNTILSLDKKQDVMIGKQDVMIGKQDVMIGKQDVMIGKQDETTKSINRLLMKQDETTQSINKLDANVTGKFNNLDQKYGKIAENLEKILVEMKEERKEFRLSIEKLIKSILKSKII